MKNQKFLKLVGALLLSAVLLFSGTAVTANLTKLTTMTTTQGNYHGNSHFQSRTIIWDNGADDGSGVSLSSQNDLAYPFNSQVADDFQLTTSASITDVHWWGAFWNGADYPNPTEFNIIFYADSWIGNSPTGGGMPDPTPTALAVYNFPSVTGTLVGAFRYEYDVTLPTAFSAAANTKYWLAVQWVGSFSQYGQWGWVVNGGNPDQLHYAMQGFPLNSMPYWTGPGTPPGQYGDMAFYLAQDTTPPVTTCVLAGTFVGGVYVTDVTATLSATDDNSGVNHTYYKIDSGAWTTYTVPFVVTGNGEHTIHFYSTDVAGNQETEKTSVFTIQYPIIITIKGGLGASATIKNNGTTALTNLSWSITLDGGFILLGKTKSDTIATLGAGEETTVKDFVFGFGKTTITATAGIIEETATGTVILFFVLGVK